MGKKKKDGRGKKEDSRGFCHRGKGSKGIRGRERQAYNYEQDSYRSFVRAAAAEGFEVHRVDGGANYS